MSFVLYLFGSGLAFWLGAALVLAGFCGRVFAKQKWHDRTSVYAVDIGLIFVLDSAAPLPWAAYAAILGFTILWLLTQLSLRLLQLASMLTVCRLRLSFHMFSTTLWRAATFRAWELSARRLQPSSRFELSPMERPMRMQEKRITASIKYSSRPQTTCQVITILHPGAQTPWTDRNTINWQTSNITI